MPTKRIALAAALFIGGSVLAVSMIGSAAPQRSNAGDDSTEEASPRASTYEDTGRLAGPELAAALSLESQLLEEGSSGLPGCPTDVWTAKDDDGTAYCVDTEHITTDPVEEWDIAMRLAGTVPTDAEIREYEQEWLGSTGANSP